MALSEQLSLDFSDISTEDKLYLEAMKESAIYCNRRELLKEKRPDWKYQKTFKGLDWEDV